MNDKCRLILIGIELNIRFLIKYTINVENSALFWTKAKMKISPL